jgi:hypothetical protein
MVVGALGFFMSCTKVPEDDGGSDSRELPNDVKEILTPDQQDLLEDHGLIVNEGLNPPDDVTGQYYSDANYCTYDSMDLFENQFFDNYYYRFYNQNNTDFSISLDYQAEYAGDSASGQGAFITGSGDLFSVFVEVSGTSLGVNYTSVYIYSAEYTSSGLKNFTFGFIITSKGDDPFGLLMPVEGHRVFEENDVLRFGATENLAVTTSYWPAASIAASAPAGYGMGVLAGGR